MNKSRRKECERIAALLDEARTALEYVKDEEQDAYDNMPEGFQNGERGEKMEECIAALDEIIDGLGDFGDTLLFDM